MLLPETLELWGPSWVWILGPEITPSGRKMVENSKNMGEIRAFGQKRLQNALSYETLELRASSWI